MHTQNHVKLHVTGAQKRDCLSQLDEIRKTSRRGRNGAWMNINLPDRRDGEIFRSLGAMGTSNKTSACYEQNFKLYFILVTFS